MRRRAAIASILCAWIFSFPLSGDTFALRGLGKGDRVPDLTFVGITAESGKLSSFSGEKGLIVIYWATWSSRSNADHQEMRREEIEAVKGKATEMALSFPVMLDAGLEGYNEIGIITVPTTLILDGDLKIVDVYPGFPSIARDDIPDRIDAFLGIEKKKRPEKTQYLLDHKPKNHALQYYNLGKTLFVFARSPSGRLRNVPENAIERLDEAIRRDPDFFRPYLLKTIIFDMAGDEGRRDVRLPVPGDGQRGFGLFPQAILADSGGPGCPVRPGGVFGEEGGRGLGEEGPRHAPEEPPGGGGPRVRLCPVLHRLRGSRAGLGRGSEAHPGEAARDREKVPGDDSEGRARAAGRFLSSSARCFAPTDGNFPSPAGAIDSADRSSPSAAGGPASTDRSFPSSAGGPSSADRSFPSSAGDPASADGNFPSPAGGVDSADRSFPSSAAGGQII
jgi:hypothetical protein